MKNTIVLKVVDVFKAYVKLFYESNNYWHNCTLVPNDSQLFVILLQTIVYSR